MDPRLKVEELRTPELEKELRKFKLDEIIELKKKRPET